MAREEAFNFSLPLLSLVPDNSLPLRFQEMTQNSWNCVFLYSCLFIVAVSGNISVLYSVLRQIFKFRVRTRIMLLILHLSIADLIVTFFLIPMEIGWRISIQWYGGNLFCKLCQFFRAFGLYLSSLIIICISMDRYFAIMHPMRVINGKKTVKYMLAAAWIAAILSSLPQSMIFSLKSHPVYQNFQNCVSIGYFQSHEKEILYNIFSVSVLYFAPLVIIVSTYSLILKKITKKAKEHQQILKFVSESLKQQSKEHIQKTDYNDRTVFQNEKMKLHPSGSTPARTTQNQRLVVIIPMKPAALRRSDDGRMVVARNRALRLTLFIVIAFVLCSTPYIIMVLWYMFDRESATKVDDRLQDVFFLMVVGNSVVNPLIYGNFAKASNLFCGLKSVTSCFRSRSSHSQCGSGRSSGLTKITTVNARTPADP